MTSGSEPPLLTIENLSISYPSQLKRQGFFKLTKQPSIHALCDLSMSVKSGELVGILGPNGSGKTSLLRAIAGFERPTSGQINLAQQTLVNHQTWVPPQQRSIGMVFQGLALFPHMTTAQNIAFGLHQLTTSQRRVKVDEICELCQISDLKHRYAYELSGGQQQRVAIARAIAPEPQLLLLDEPFAHLDPGHRRHLGEEIRTLLKQLSISSIMVIHDKTQALELSDQVAFIFNGQLAQFGTPQEVFENPRTATIASFLGDRNFIPCTLTHQGCLTPFGTIDSHRITLKTAAPLSTPDSTTTTNMDNHTHKPITPSIQPHHDHMMMVCKSDDFMLINSSTQLQTTCTPQPFNIISESFKGLYKTIRAKLKSGHIITFQLSSDDRTPLESMKICLKNKQYCVYEVCPRTFMNLSRPPS